MSNNGFNADAGYAQERVKRSPTADGIYAYELGSSVAGIVRQVATGDKHRISQTWDLTSAQVLRLALYIRGEDSSGRWDFNIRVDGSIVVSRQIDSRTRDLTDVAVNLFGLGLSGMVPLDLELVFTGSSPGTSYEVLPGCAIDDLTVDNSAPAISVLNRNPEDGEQNVRLDVPWMFDIEPTSDNGLGNIDLSRTTVYVDDIIVYQAGSFTTEWAGSSTQATPTNGVQFQLSFGTPFTSDVDYSIRVVSTRQLDVDDSLDVSWSFHTADEIAPLLVSAEHPTIYTVFAQFDDTLLQDESDASALNPNNYVLTLVDGLPAVTPVVVSVELVTTRSVILSLDTPLTNGATYALTASNITDLVGNTMPSTTTLFCDYAFNPRRNIELYQRFSQHDRDGDEEGGDLRELCDIWQDTFDVIAALIDAIPLLWSTDTAPDAWIDLILWDLASPWERFTSRMTTAQKRFATLIIPHLNKQMGTAPAIVDAIRLFMGIEVTVSVYAWGIAPVGEAVFDETFILGSADWGDRLTLRIHVPVIMTDAQRADMRYIVDRCKAERELYVLVEPPPPPYEPDHWEVGWSHMDTETFLH